MGLFDRQKLFAGERLDSAFAEGERFVLHDLAVVAEDNTEMVPGSTVDKTELVVSHDGSNPFLVSTLSGPIRDLAYRNVRGSDGQPLDTDLPCWATYKKVDTKNNFDNQATVLDFVEPFVGVVSGHVPPFNLPPITTDSNPLEEPTEPKSKTTK